MAFRFTLPVRLLREALPRLRAVAPRRSTLPVLSCILIARSKGETSLTATDLDVSLTRLVPSVLPVPTTDLGRDLLAQRHGREDGSLAVPVSTLTTVAKAADIESEIVVTDEGLRYKLGGSPVTCEDFIAGEEFPPAAQPAGDFHLLNETIRAGIISALECVSVDASRYVLNGVYLSEKAIVATDGQQLLMTQTPFPAVAAKDVIAPTKTITVLTKQLGNFPWSLNVDPSVPRIFFRAGDWTLASKVIDGNFPNYPQVLLADSDKQEVFPITEPLRQEILTVLQRLPLNTNSNTVPLDTVQLNTDGGKVIQFSAGQPRMNVHSDRDHSKRRFCGKREFFKRAVSHGFTELRILDELSPLVARKATTTYIFMPCRAA